MFDLRDLEILVMVSKWGKITKAAEALGYAQPNITARIKKLEKQIGQELLIRTKSGVTFTSIGKVLLHYARHIIQLDKEAESAVKGLCIPNGELRIGSMETTAYVRLPIILSKYSCKYPQVKLSLQTGTSQELIQKVLHHEIDGAFVAGPTLHADLVKKVVYNERLVIIRKPMDKALKSKKCAVIAFKKGCYYREVLLQILSDLQINVYKIIEVDSPLSIINFVSHGLGISIIPLHLVKAINSVEIVPIHKDYMNVDTVFITNKNSPHMCSLDQFIDLLK